MSNRQQQPRARYPDNRPRVMDSLEVSQDAFQKLVSIAPGPPSLLADQNRRMSLGKCSSRRTAAVCSARVVMVESTGARIHGVMGKE